MVLQIHQNSQKLVGALLDSLICLVALFFKCFLSLCFSYFSPKDLG